jgi:capsular exopolysaccharide synthesis family protein
MWRDPLSSRAYDDDRSLGHPESNVSVAELLFGSLRVLRRRAKLAMLVFVLYAVPALIFVGTRPPIYLATARILVERNSGASSVFKERNGDSVVDTFFQTQSQVLRSRPIIAKTIEKIRLWESPQFAGSSTIEKPTQRSSPALIDAFLQHLSTSPTPGTHLLSVAFEASDGALAMNAVNALTETYVEEQTRTDVTASSETVGWLNEQLGEQRKRLDASEASLQNYMERHDALSVQDRQNIVVQKLADLNTALTKAKTDRIAKEATFEQLKSVQEDSSVLATLPVVLSNALLQQLRGQLAELKQKELTLNQEFGDRHPEMVTIRKEIDLANERLRVELIKLTESVKHDYLEAQAIEQNLVNALNGQKRDVLDLNRKSIEYGALQRQATSDRQIYEQLLTETKTRGVTRTTPDTKITIVEPAELPPAPIGPRNTRDSILVLAAGLILAIGAPLVIDSFDRRLKTPTDVEQSLRLRCIAMVPSLNERGTRPALVGDAATAFNEAFRRIRATVALSADHQGMSRVLVTSTAPQEGKSLVAANLAVALARTGQRVLLIDGDLRRPVLHKTFGIKAVPGLSDLLTKDANAGTAIHTTDHPNLFVLPCGSTNVAAAELLSSPSLPLLLSALDSKFNWIIFDSPPIGPVADACIIAPMVQRTLVVVAADMTLAAAAGAAVDQLKAAGVVQVTAVLNRVDLKHSAYYYAPYHYKEYSLYQSVSTESIPRTDRTGALT